MNTNLYIRCAIVLIVVLASEASSQHQHQHRQPDSDELRVKFTKGHIVPVGETGDSVRIDIPGFEQTFDGQNNGTRILTVGHGDRRLVLTIDFDTLYEDVGSDPKEYKDLWWYFYTEQEDSELGRTGEWRVDNQYWSTHTVVSAHGMDVNERHYSLFQVSDEYWYRVTIRRPFYLEGDSVFMVRTLESFKTFPNATETVDEAKGADEKGR